MATKLKKFSYSKGLQLGVFVITVLLLCWFSYLLAKNFEIIRFIHADNQLFNQLLKLFYFIGLVFLACLCYLIITTGRKSEDDPIHLTPIDKIYVELNLGLLIAAFIFACYILIWLVRTRMEHPLNYMLLTVEALTIALGLAMFLSLIRHLKNRSFLQNSICCVLAIRLYSFFFKIFTGGQLMIQIAIAVVVLGLLTMIPWLGIITIPLALWLAFNWVKRFNLISSGVEKIKNGEYNAKIEIDQPGEFKLLAENLNQIADGLNREVERRIKSERLKTDLISNVSHDIRTPLTAIITYVDLLKNEAIANEKARQYIETIEQKSGRLKILIDDLFEASKASSGNIPVHLEKIDLTALLRQGLGELDEQIQASALDFKINIPPTPVYVRADGKLLWRVLENLLANVFKYSLPNSRVYLDLQENEDQVALEIKNISAYELNIAEDELMERFKRGDESRHSEGSGLGLSIARSLMLSQKGRLNIKIDGDLFKALISIPKI